MQAGATIVKQELPDKALAKDMVKYLPSANVKYAERMKYSALPNVKYILFRRKEYINEFNKKFSRDSVISRDFSCLYR